MAMVSTVRCKFLGPGHQLVPKPPSGGFFLGIACSDGLLVLPAFFEILLYIRAI